MAPNVGLSFQESEFLRSTNHACMAFNVRLPFREMLASPTTSLERTCIDPAPAAPLHDAQRGSIVRLLPRQHFYMKIYPIYLGR